VDYEKINGSVIRKIYFLSFVEIFVCSQNLRKINWGLVRQDHSHCGESHDPPHIFFLESACKCLSRFHRFHNVFAASSPDFTSFNAISRLSRDFTILDRIVSRLSRDFTILTHRSTRSVVFSSSPRRVVGLDFGNIGDIFSDLRNGGVLGKDVCRNTVQDASLDPREGVH